MEKKEGDSAVIVEVLNLLDRKKKEERRINMTKFQKLMIVLTTVMTASLLVIAACALYLALTWSSYVPENQTPREPIKVQVTCVPCPPAAIPQECPPKEKPVVEQKEKPTPPPVVKETPKTPVVTEVPKTPEAPVVVTPSPVEKPQSDWIDCRTYTGKCVWIGGKTSRPLPPVIIPTKEPITPAVEAPVSTTTTPAIVPAVTMTSSIQKPIEPRKDLPAEVSLPPEKKPVSDWMKCPKPTPPPPPPEKKAVCDLTKLTPEDRAYIAKVAPNGTTTIEQVKSDKELQKILDKLVQQKAVVMASSQTIPQTQQR